MSRSVAAFTLCVALAGLSWVGCAGGEGKGTEPSSGRDASGPYGAVVSIEPQAWLVRQIGGDRVTVTTMVPPGQSPHSYEPVPGQLAEVARARIYLAMGTGVEFETAHLATLREQAPSMSVVSIGEGIPLRPVDGAGCDHHDHGDHAGHDHATDPHVWLAPAHLETLAIQVREGLTDVDPGHRERYAAATESLLAQLDQLDGELRGLLEPLAGESFLVVHPSWGYFADAYGLEQLAVEEEGRQPGPVGVAAVIAQSREAGIRTVFTSPQFDASAAEVIAAEIGGQVITADPLASDPPAQLRALARALAGGTGE